MPADPRMRIQPAIDGPPRRPVMGDRSVRHFLARAAATDSVRNLVFEPSLKPRKTIDPATTTTGIGEILEVVVGDAQRHPGLANRISGFENGWQLDLGRKKIFAAVEPGTGFSVIVPEARASGGEIRPEEMTPLDRQLQVLDRDVLRTRCGDFANELRRGFGQSGNVGLPPARDHDTLARKQLHRSKQLCRFWRVRLERPRSFLDDARERKLDHDGLHRAQQFQVWAGGYHGGTRADDRRVLKLQERFQKVPRNLVDPLGVLKRVAHPAEMNRNLLAEKLSDGARRSGTIPVSVRQPRRNVWGSAGNTAAPGSYPPKDSRVTERALEAAPPITVQSQRQPAKKNWLVSDRGFVYRPGIRVSSSVVIEHSLHLLERGIQVAEDPSRNLVEHVVVVRVIFFADDDHRFARRRPRKPRPRRRWKWI